MRSAFAVGACTALLAVSITTSALAAPAAGQGKVTRQPGHALAGVTVAGVDVGGLTYSQAVARLNGALAGPRSKTTVRLRFANRRWLVRLDKFGYRAGVYEAARAAVRATSPHDLPIRERLDQRLVTRYLGALGPRVGRPARSATLRLVGTRPAVTAGRSGIALDADAAQPILTKALLLRRPARLPAIALAPAVTRAGLGATIVIDRSANTLTLYRDGDRFRKRYRVATGQAQYPTPLGAFTIISLQRNPTWTPPDSPWAEGEKPVPPGPDNPIGTRWMGISSPGVGIHGTPDANSIGYSRSHGCIRMRIPEAEELFERVRYGTPVFIVA